MYALCVVSGLILMIGFYLLLIKSITGKSPLWFLNKISPAQLLAFSTSSSGATLPVTMKRCEKDLGVYVDYNLNFEHHINVTIRKAKNIAFLILRNFHFKSPYIMVPLFKALIRAILEYGNVVWSPYMRKDINAIEEVQRFYTKRIIGMNNLEYEDRLSKLKLPSLEFRRLRGDMIEVFKITNGMYDVRTTNNFFELCDSMTRSNGKKLTKPQVSFKPFQEFFY